MAFFVGNITFFFGEIVFKIYKSLFTFFSRRRGRRQEKKTVVATSTNEEEENKGRKNYCSNSK